MKFNEYVQWKLFTKNSYKLYNTCVRVILACICDGNW